MPISWIDCDNADFAIDYAAAGALGARGQGLRPVVIVPSFSDVAVAKKALSNRSASLGVEVCSFVGWLNELWELFGDGRTVISASERLARCARLVQGCDDLSAKGSVSRLLSDVVTAALPRLMSADAGKLSENERTLVELSRAYGAQLADDGLVELCVAAHELPENLFSRFAVFAVGFTPDTLSPVQTELFERACARMTYDRRLSPRQGEWSRAAELDEVLTVIYRQDHANPVVPSGSLRFAFPSGKVAERQLIVEQLARWASEYPSGTFVVASTDPSGLFRDLLSESELADVSIGHAGGVSFVRTDAGRLLYQLSDAIGLHEGASANVRAGADLLLNPLCGLKPSRAFSVAAEWRGNRLMTSEALADQLALRLPRGLRPIVQAVRSGRIAEALDVLRRFVQTRTHMPEWYREQQLSVIATAYDLAVEAEACGVSSRLTLELLEKAASGESICAPAGSSPQAYVRVMTIEDAACLEPASCDVLLVTEMNSNERPVRGEESSKRTLLAKIGIEDASDPLVRMRRDFYDAVSVSRHRVVLERCIHAGDAEPQYPAALFEETVDCYRSFDRSTEGGHLEELVEPYAITNSLMSFSSKASESDFVHAVAGSQGQDVDYVDELPPVGAISAESSHLIVLPRSNETASLPGLDLSPSAIESYLECPHRWFVQRRLSLDTPDEGFGALERGTFVHLVLQKFYEQLRLEGHARVCAENVEYARLLLESTFDEVANGQYEKDPGRRYVAVSRWEREHLNAIKRKLSSYVASEPSFLPGFEPTYFELNCGMVETCLYAGHRLRGTIDRIDVDSHGNAVVIDYKTGISKAFDAHEKNPDFANGLPLPRKMQALVYAKVVRNGVGFGLPNGLSIERVVGALYVNPLTGAVHGAYDAHVLGPESIPGVNAARACVPFGRIASFEEFLDETEQVVARRLEGLGAGDIHPDPYSAEVCSYCPAMLCERRLS